MPAAWQGLGFLRGFVAIGHKILIVTLLHWASSARITSELVQAGADVDVVCTDFHPVLSVQGVARRHLCRMASPMRRLAAAIEISKPRLIIPTDDFALRCLQALRSDGPAPIAERIEASLGPADSVETIFSRQQFAEAARAAGADVPAGAVVSTVDDLRLWLEGHGDSGFLKLDGTCGGVGVRRVRTGDDLGEALASLRREAASSVELRRHDAPVVMSVQKEILGHPANCCGFAWDGEVRGVVSVKTLETLHPFGVATVVRPVEHAGMRRAAVDIARSLRLTGFFGLDFVLESATDRAWVIEMNFRPTPIAHFALGPGRDLVASLLAQLDGAPERPRPQRFGLGEAVGVFPHVLRDPAPVCYPDLPVDAPALIAAFDRRRVAAEWRGRLRGWLRASGVRAPDKFGFGRPEARTPVEMREPTSSFDGERTVSTFRTGLADPLIKDEA